MHSIAKLVIGYSDYFTNSNPFFLKKLVFVITGPIEMNLENTNQSNIQCIATGARPAPNFKWYIADELLENITGGFQSLDLIITELKSHMTC